MRIVVDENIPARTVAWLRAEGHVVTDVRESSLRGADDDAVWAMSQRERALLITTDKGFAARWKQPHSGVLVVRLRQPNRERIHERVVLAIREKATTEAWRGVLCVMRDQVRSVRKTPGPGDGGSP